MVKTKKGGLSHKQLTVVRDDAAAALETLVRPRGIYASTDAVMAGPFHHYFGRDSAITALLILEAETLTGKPQFSSMAYGALTAFSKFQGWRDNPANGEQAGRIAHEVQTSPSHIKAFQASLLAAGESAWYVDPEDGHLKNWDSVDATPMWVMTICRFIEAGYPVSNGILRSLVFAVEWCLRQQAKNGYIGWLPAAQQPGRTFGGLYNHTWKDSMTAFEYSGGGKPHYPLYDVYSNAALWAALMHASRVLAAVDRPLAVRAWRSAAKLRRRFNSYGKGFYNRQQHFYAEALDAHGWQLNTPSIDVGMALGLHCSGKSVVDGRHTAAVIRRLTQPDFLHPGLGIGNYPSTLKHYEKDDQYHRGPAVFWPFANALTAIGFSSAGDAESARLTLENMLHGMKTFESFAELYIGSDDKAVQWHRSGSNRTGARTQAWSAAAAYYGASYLLKGK